jgi:hypothetical protein
MSHTPPSMFASIAAMKCPACRKHAVFIDPNILKLKSIASMYEYCPVCHSSNKVEPGFYFGAAYVSYMLMVGLLMAFVLVYYVIFGEIFNHFWRLMSGAFVLALVSTPLVFRYSRIIFLYICVKYKGENHS